MLPWLVSSTALAAGAGLWAARRARAARLAAAEAALAERALRAPWPPAGVTVGPSEGPTEGPPAGPSAAWPDDLPDPVARYLDRVLPPDRRGLRLARYRQRGELRTDARAGRWLPFTATQSLGAPTAEFLWIARVVLAPGLHLQVGDRLVGGHGGGDVALWSALPVTSARAGPALDSGSLHRFLAEAVWCPSALLPSPWLRWTALDAARAVATLAAGAQTVALEFRFNTDDEVQSVYTPARWGAFGGGFEQVAWEGRFGPCVWHDGVRVPAEAEVGWIPDGRWCAVWRGRVESAQMRFA
jgi:hypothetical protein